MARGTNSNNEQMKIIGGLEDDKDMCLERISVRAAENVDGKPGYIVNCSYRMDPDKVTEDTPYEKRSQDEDYISTTKEKALAYVEDRMSALLGEDSGDDGDSDEDDSDSE